MFIYKQYIIGKSIAIAKRPLNCMKNTKPTRQSNKINIICANLFETLLIIGKKLSAEVIFIVNIKIYT